MKQISFSAAAAVYALARSVRAPTMDEFFFRTFLPRVQLRSRSYQTHAALYRNHLQTEFGHRRLNRIDTEEVIEFASRLRRKHVANGRWGRAAHRTLSEGTVKRILILLRHIFNEAIRTKDTHIKVNPTHALRLTTARRVVGRFLTPGQLKALLNAAQNSRNADLADIIRIMVATGLRRDNVLRMRWSWLDDARGTLTVPEDEDKAKKGFVLHLSNAVVIFRHKGAISFSAYRGHGFFGT